MPRREYFIERRCTPGAQGGSYVVNALTGRLNEGWAVVCRTGRITLPGTWTRNVASSIARMCNAARRPTLRKRLERRRMGVTDLVSRDRAE